MPCRHRLLLPALAAGAVTLAGLGTAPTATATADATASSAATTLAAALADDAVARRERRAEDLARTAARTHAPLGTRDALVVGDTVLDRGGASHVRFARTYDGLDVVGADVVVHQDAAGRFDSISGATPRLALRTRATVRRAAARAVAVGAVDFRPSAVQVDKVVLAVGGKPRLTWQVEVRGTRADGAPAGQRVFVAARGGARVLRQWPSIYAETGSGESLYSGTVPLDTVLGSNGVYAMVEPDRGAGRTVEPRFRGGGFGGATRTFRDGDNLWGDGTVADPQTAAVDAHFGGAVTWDYYLDRFGRVGIRDDGVGARSVVHVGRFTNAFWDDTSFAMYYGDGNKRDRSTPLVTLDITGHEMSHGVTSSTADLVYWREPGGLNEATSDIMGTNVEFAAGNTAEGTDVGDYLIGEEVFHYADESRNYLRRMDQPSLDGVSQDCWNARTRRIDVHYSSGPANHFYYLLAEGSGEKTINGIDYFSPTCNNAAVEGIGREKAEQIWYRALTVYMTPRTNYRGARRATAQAARDLYGVNSVEAVTVKAAWSAVRVG